MSPGIATSAAALNQARRVIDKLSCRDERMREPAPRPGQRRLRLAVDRGRALRIERRLAHALRMELLQRVAPFERLGKAKEWIAKPRIGQALPEPFESLG